MLPSVDAIRPRLAKRPAASPVVRSGPSGSDAEEVSEPNALRTDTSATSAGCWVFSAVATPQGERALLERVPQPRGGFPVPSGKGCVARQNVPSILAH